MIDHFDFFQAIRSKLLLDAQILIAYHWRKKLIRILRKRNMAKKRENSFRGDKTQNKLGKPGNASFKQADSKNESS